MYVVDDERPATLSWIEGGKGNGLYLVIQQARESDHNEFVLHLHVFKANHVWIEDRFAELIPATCTASVYVLKSNF